jgi:hypothetical protein
MNANGKSDGTATIDQGHRRELLLAVVLTLGGGVVMGCSTEPAAAPEAPATTLLNGLTIDVATHVRLAGTVTKADQRLAFDFEVAPDGARTVTFRHSAGDLLMRTTFFGEEQIVEFGGKTTLRGPRGGLASRSDGLRAEEAAAIASVKNDPAFDLIKDLPEKLQQRGDIDLSMLPRFGDQTSYDVRYSCGNEFLNSVCPPFLDLAYLGCWWACIWDPNNSVCRTCVVAHALFCAPCLGL